MPAPGGRPHLSIVVPALDEAERLPRTLPDVLRYLDERRIDGEIVVVDDGSTDDTARVAGALVRGRGHVIHYPDNRGKGHAVRQGLLAARGRWALVTDADLSAPIDEHAKLAAAVRDGDLDVAIGSRALPGSQVELRQGRLRELMGQTFNRIVRAATKLPFHDTQCGFKLLDLPRVTPLVERMVVDGFAWDVELLYLCRRFNLRVAEVPVVWRNDPRTSVDLLVQPLRMLRDLARIRWRFRRGAYLPVDDGKATRSRPSSGGGPT